MLIALALVLAATPADEPNPFLAQAKEDLAHLEYAKCAEHLREGASWKNSRAELLELELYAGVCAFSLRKEDDAAEHFRLALKIDREAALPALVSPKIRRLFERIRGELPAASDAPTKAELTPEPREPAVEELTPRAQRNRTIAFALGGIAVATASLGVYFGASAADAEARSRTDRFEQDARADAIASRDAATAANVSYLLAAGAAIGAVVAWVLQERPAP